jgi:hypothetical protein
LKNAFKVIATLLFTSAIVVLMLPGVVSAATSPSSTYPASINGLPVVLVEDSANTPSVPAGHVILCVYDNSSATMKDSIAKLNSANYLENNSLPSGWSIEVFGGAGATVQQFISTYNINNDYQKVHGVVKFTNPSITNTSSSVTPDSGTPNGAFAIDQNYDPNTQTITYQAAFFTSPFIAINQNDYSYFGNNMCTNGKVMYKNQLQNWFIQSGQIYYNWEGLNVYSDQSFGYQPENFNVPFITGDQMAFELYLNPSTGQWEQTCYDLSQNVWAYHVANYVTGTKAVTLAGTSIFFENWNNVSNWYLWFTNPINSSNALDGTYNNMKSWNNQFPVLLNSQGGTQPNNGQMTGSLVNGQTESWWLQNLLLNQ